MRVAVFSRMVYGQLKFYPANETAERFAQLLNARTFNREQLRQIAELGFQIEQVADPATRLPGAAA